MLFNGPLENKDVVVPNLLMEEESHHVYNETLITYHLNAEFSKVLKG